MSDILNLIRTICKNGESGRLEILAGAIQGELSFKNGKLVDARVGHLTGFQAINAAASMQNARASFDPAFETLASSSIRPSERVVLKQFFGIETAETYFEPAVMSVPEETAKTVLMEPVSAQADEVTIVRPNTVPSSMPPPPPPSRFSYPIAMTLAALVIGIAAAGAVLLFNVRERNASAVATTVESPAHGAAAAGKQPDPGVVESAPAQQPQSRVVQSAPVQSAPGSTRVKERSELHTTAQNLSGKWNLVNTVETTSHQSYKNMKIGFHVSIDQSGTSITGRGQKVSENGRPLPVKSRTPIQVKGSINGDTIEATFFEEGTGRKTNGRFVWRVDKAGRGLTGSFATTAARSRGKSAATRAL